MKDLLEIIEQHITKAKIEIAFEEFKTLFEEMNNMGSCDIIRELKNTKKEVKLLSFRHFNIKESERLGTINLENILTEKICIANSLLGICEDMRDLLVLRL